MKPVKNLTLWLVIVILAYLMWEVVQTNQPKIPEITYSAFLSQIESGNVASVTIHKNWVNASCRDHDKCPYGYSMFNVTVPTSQEGMLQTLRQNKVEIVVKD